MLRLISCWREKPKIVIARLRSNCSDPGNSEKNWIAKPTLWAGNDKLLVLRQRLLVIPVILGLVIFLSACGQYGKLYLPKEECPKEIQNNL